MNWPRTPRRAWRALARPVRGTSIKSLFLLTIASMTLAVLVVTHAAAAVSPHPSATSTPAAGAARTVATPTPTPTPALTATATTPTRPVLAAPMVARPAHLVVLGDSVPAAAACQCAGFAADLAHALPATLTNDAVSGQDSAGLIEQLNNPTLQEALRTATVVTVTIGANDFNPADASNPLCRDLSCYSSTMHTLTGHITTILDKLHQLTPASSTVVITGYWNVFLDGQVGALMGTTYVAISNALTLAVNSQLKSFTASPHVDYTDLYQPFKGTGNDDTGLLADDGDHPNTTGHTLIATAIEATLAAQ